MPIELRILPTVFEIKHQAEPLLRFRIELGIVPAVVHRHVERDDLRGRLHSLRILRSRLRNSRSLRGVGFAFYAPLQFPGGVPHPTPAKLRRIRESRRAATLTACGAGHFGPRLRCILRPSRTLVD